MNESMKRYKAEQLRYRKAIMAGLNLERINDSLYDMATECDDIKWMMEDDETLLDALDGDSDEEYEFRMMFSDLSAKIERLRDTLYDTYVTEHFDEFMVAIIGNKYNVIGYDSFEEDYFDLTMYETELAQTESGKRIMRLKKEEIISVCGQCLGIVTSYLDVEYTYKYFKASYDVLKDNNVSLLKIVKDINDAYENNASYLDTLIRDLPDRYWIE